MTTLVQRPPEARAGHDNRRRLVVIGNGMAGARVVEEILARDGARQFSITMFGDEPYGNYNRIMLSHVLSGEESHEAIFLNSLEWYDENGITLHAGVRVQRIDRFAKVAFSDDGQITPYDELIIATGSRSFMPPTEGLYTSDGSLLSGVFAFRTIDDTRGMIERATRDDHRRAVVIGGGLLGLEAARGLQSHGIEVDVVHSGRWLMNAQLGREGGEVLRRSMAQLGVGIFTKNRVATIWVQTRSRVYGSETRP
jgi:nitrite reductase [NAD(P)H] large subunit